MNKINNLSGISNDSLKNSASTGENSISRIFNYNGNNVTFKTKNGVVYINATEMAKPFGKKPAEYLRLPSTNEFIHAVAKRIEHPDNQSIILNVGFSHIVDNQLVITYKGGVPGASKQGTWLHEDIAIDFAQWLSIDFRLWCNDRIKELLTYGVTATDTMLENMLNDPDLAISLFSKLKEERKAKEEALKAKQVAEQNLVLEQHRSAILEMNLEEAKPKAEYFDDLVNRKLNINLRNTAKEIHVKEKEFINKLLEKKFLYRDIKGKLLPFAQYVDDLFVVKEYSNDKHSGVQVLVTPKGRQTFMILFRKNPLL